MQWRVADFVPEDHPTMLVGDGDRLPRATEWAGTVRHKEDTISLEDFEKRLEKYEKEHGPVEGVCRINLRIVGADAVLFERERIGPNEERSR